MKRSALFALLVIIVLLTGSCSDHIVQPLELANGRVIGTVHGIISDYGTHQVMDSAAVKITWMMNGETRTAWSGALGYYSVTGLCTGEHELTFWGSSDYAVSRMTVTIPTPDELVQTAPATDEDYQYSLALNVDLYKKDAGLSGRVLRTAGSGALIPAAGVTVTADYTLSIAAGLPIQGGYNCYPGRYTTASNDSGFFALDSLPSTPTVVLHTMPWTFSADSTYGMEYMQTRLVAGTTLKLSSDVILTLQ